jgi:hypothetical protein
MPGKVAEFLLAAELDDDAERAALDQGVTVRRGKGYTLRVSAVPPVHRALLAHGQPRVREPGQRSHALTMIVLSANRCTDVPRGRSRSLRCRRSGRGCAGAGPVGGVVDGYLDAVRARGQVESAGAAAVAQGVGDELRDDQDPRCRRPPLRSGARGGRGSPGCFRVRRRRMPWIGRLRRRRSSCPSDHPGFWIVPARSCLRGACAPACGG